MNLRFRLSIVNGIIFFLAMSTFILYVFFKISYLLILLFIFFILYSVTLLSIHRIFRKFLKNIKEDYYKISEKKFSYPLSEINEFGELIKTFIAQDKLVEAVNITLSKNSDSPNFYKVVVENLGLIFSTPHLCFIVYDPVVRKCEFMYGNGLFSNSKIIKASIENFKDSNILYRDEYLQFLDSEINPAIFKLKNLGIIHLSSTLNYKGYVLFGSEKEEITTKFFDRYNFLILEISTSFNSHINNKKLKEKINELNLLNKIITLMETNKDIDEVLYLFLTHVTAREGLSFNRAIIFKKNDNLLEGLYSIGPLTYEEADLKWNQIKTLTIDFYLERTSEKIVEPLEKITKSSILKIVDDPILNEITFSKKHKIVNFENSNFSKENREILSRFNLKEFVIVPLVSYDNFFGILIADNAFDNKFLSDERLYSLLSFTAQTSLVINNLILYNKIKNMAIKDELTKLYNRRFYEEQLSLEIERATRHKQSLSLLMIDIDYFKNYNDKNGHVAGDSLLSTIAQIFKDTCRSSDYVCRYGGEEFSIILPETDIIGAYEVGEKIRKKVFSNTFPFGENQPNKKLTISVGVATFPHLASDKKELKENADKALYYSKKTGRNKVTIYSPEIINKI